MTADPIVAAVLRRVRLRAALRADWLRTIWPDEPGQTGGWAVTHDEVDRHLAVRDDPAAEAAWTAEHADDDRLRYLEVAEETLDTDGDSRLAHLGRVFRLSDAERDLVQACLAADVDPDLLRVYAYLQDDAARRFVTDRLVERLFGHGGPVRLDACSPLLRWRIVRSTETGIADPPARALDRAVRDWLLGGDDLDPELAGIARIQPVLPTLPDWPIDQAAKDLDGWLRPRPPTPVSVRVTGLPGTGRRSFAAALADRLGFPVLTVDTAAVAPDGLPAVHLTAQRRAFLDRCAPAFVGPSGARGGAGGTGGFGGTDLPARFPLQFEIDEALASADDGSSADAVHYPVALPPPSLATRRALWRSYAPWSADWPDEELELLVTQHRTRPGEFAALARHGRTTPERAGVILRDAGRDSLGELARRLDCPFEPGDLVLAPRVQNGLDDLLFEAEDRAALWERAPVRRLFPQGRGLLALFCGPPGTGKTMSAQVLAARLGMDLYRIDLATVVSKWVGETSRNVDRLLRRAASLDVVLLFDEADALFGRRTEIKEANDRFANTDTGYLLQAIESYEGIALLSTNRRADIDPAFVRRIRYVLDYPMPDPAERLRLWRTLVGALAGTKRAEALAPGLARLATAVDVSGAQIKFAVLSAVFAARRDGGGDVTVEHLLGGLERELAKEGRPLADRLRERLVADAG